MGFGAGLYYFYKGFRVFREYRVLMDTPEIPIRSVAMGLVEIHGKATGIPPIPSPVTQTPCYFYKVDIEHWVTDKNGGHWITPCHRRRRKEILRRGHDRQGAGGRAQSGIRFDPNRQG